MWVVQRWASKSERSRTEMVKLCWHTPTLRPIKSGMIFSCIFLTYRKVTAAGNRTQDLPEYVTSMQRENVPELMAQGSLTSLCRVISATPMTVLRQFIRGQRSSSEHPNQTKDEAQEANQSITQDNVVFLQRNFHGFSASLFWRRQAKRPWVKCSTFQ